MPSIINATLSNGLVTSADNSGEIELQSNGTTALKVNTNEGIQILNCLGVGNATPSTSGAGITFPATQSASTDANTLDDYEEGTFTPTVSGGITSPTYAKQVGQYTKIGNLVHIQLSVELNGGTRNANTLVIGNLPFTQGDFNGGVGYSIAYVDQDVINSTTTNLPTPYGDANTVNISFYNTTGVGFVGNSLSAATIRIDLTGNYRV